MSSNYPTGLDSFTDPATTDKTNSPSHAGQHQDVNDAIEKLEAKLGIDSSAVTTSHDYKLSNVTGSTKAPALIDEDDMASNSATASPSQQSVVQYLKDEYTALQGWNPYTTTCTYASATTFTIAGTDATAIFRKGTKLKLTNSTVKYFYVVSSSFSTNTTVTVTGGSDYELASAAISNVFVSYVENPQSFPHWFNYTPSYSANGSMTYTSVTTDDSRFCVRGTTVHGYIRAYGTTGGTANTAIRFTPPIAISAENTAEPVGSAVATEGSTDYGAFLAKATTTIAQYKYDVSNYGLGATRYIRGSYTYEF